MDNVNSKVYDVTTWETNNCSTHTVQYLKKGDKIMKFGQSVEYNRNIFLEKPRAKCGREIIPRPYSKKLKFIISLE